MKNTVYHDIEVNGELNIAGGGALGENLQALIVELINQHKYDDDENVYISTNSTSPAAKRGGTWERIKDVFLLAAGDTYLAGNSGGSADAVVVEHTHNVFGSSVTKLGEGASELNRVAMTSEFGNNHISTTNSSGESGKGKNMPPYLAVYVWRKIS